MDINLLMLECAVKKLKSGGTIEEKAKTMNKIIELVELMKWDKKYNLDVPEIDEQ